MLTYTNFNPCLSRLMHYVVNEVELGHMVQQQSFKLNISKVKDWWTTQSFKYGCCCNWKDSFTTSQWKHRRSFFFYILVLNHGQKVFFCWILWHKNELDPCPFRYKISLIHLNFPIILFSSIFSDMLSLQEWAWLSPAQRLKKTTGHFSGSTKGQTVHTSSVLSPVSV